MIKEQYVSLHMAKARVTPLQVISTPKQKLQTVCTAIDISKSVKQQTEIDTIGRNLPD